MFWSPALATLSVCALTDVDRMADAKPAARANLRMKSSLVMGAWKQVQSIQRQAQADWTLEVEVAIVGDGEVTIADGDRVPVVPSRIGALSDPTGQDDRAVDTGVRSVEPGDVVAEIGGDRADGSVPGPQDWLGLARLHLDAAGCSAHIELDHVIGAHEARDERRHWMVVDLLG